MSETVMSVDEIATHHTIERVMLEQIEVAAIGPSEIEFMAYGTVEVTLQWGSNSDVRNDMGAVLDDSFPLTMKFFASVDSPSEVEAVEDSLLVDTSEWYDNYYDRE